MVAKSFESESPTLTQEITKNLQKSDSESDEESDEGEEGDSVESETESVSAAPPPMGDDDRNTGLDLEDS